MRDEDLKKWSISFLNIGHEVEACLAYKLEHIAFKGAWILLSIWYVTLVLKVFIFESLFGNSFSLLWVIYFSVILIIFMWCWNIRQKFNLSYIKLGRRLYDLRSHKLLNFKDDNLLEICEDIRGV